MQRFKSLAVPIEVFHCVNHPEVICAVQEAVTAAKSADAGFIGEAA
jgi:hypothetical protein